ncbi:MAG TPA: amino acid adenylation domain-containing protein [Verrucomicrobiae bacterium]|nr:amino acid adenylation domain-containing protein [Verrucomicrobiae bacterium]
MAGVLPLSFAQEGLWFFEQNTPGTATYNVPEAWRLRGALNVNVLQRSLDEIVVRHEILRTAIGAKGGKPCQIVLPPKPFPLMVTDLRNHADPAGEAEKQAKEEARTAFDLTRQPLARVRLFRIADDEHLLVANMHHIISDAWSIGVFMRELAALYREGAVLAALPIQYGNFTLWQRESLHGDYLEKKLNYWRQQLRGASPMLALPLDRPRPQAESCEGAAEFVTWPEPLAAALKDFCRSEGTTVFRVLLAAFNILLQRLTLQDDLVVGCPFSGRDEVETEGLIGFFVNVQALRIHLGNDPVFTDVLRQAGEVALGASMHQEAPLSQIIGTMGAARRLDAQTLFQAVIGLQDDFTENWTLPGLVATHVEMESGTAKFNLTLLITETSQDLRLRFEYKTALFNAATIRRWAGQLRTLVEGIVADPRRRISEYSLTTPEERRELLELGNPPAGARKSDRCVHEIFEEQAANNPEVVALVFEGTEMSYAQLDSAGNELAAKLKEAGAGAGTFVGLCMDRSIEMIVGMLGILKSGAAYLPLDPALPESRMAFVLEDAGAILVLTRQNLRKSISAGQRKVLCIDERDWRAAPGTARRSVTAADPAYVMYTSGSTGTPKGVVVPHRAIPRLVRDAGYVTITPRDVFLQMAPISFDASTFEIWGALLNGARLVIFPPHMPSLAELGRELIESQVTILWLTAGWFHQMADSQLPALQGLRYLLAGGEALSVPHVLKTVRALKGCQLVNGYGPTEGTTFTCCYPVPVDWPGGASVPIGRPINQTRVYILDAARDPVPVGVPGELYIGGDGLALEYLNQPELTEEKFVTVRGERLYRTGDLTRWMPDGNIEFLGRMDNQVKVRGFRVEPGEIEAALATHPAVRDALVVARPDPCGGLQLVAYVLCDASTAVELREFLLRRLPAFMAPSHFVALAEFPLTANGKVDRRALPDPSVSVSPRATEPPRNATETLVAGIWHSVLECEQAGIHDNFFQLGGHSLLATQIVSRLSHALEVDIPVRMIFEAPTIAELAEAVDEARLQPAPRAETAMRRQPSQAEKLLERLDDLSDSEVEELLLELEENEIEK